MTPRPPPYLALLGLALAACVLGPYTDGTTTTDASTQPSESADSVTTGHPTTGTLTSETSGLLAPTTSGTTTTGSTSTTSTDPSSTAATFIVRPDGNYTDFDCDPWQQDCPRGEKCNWYGADGSNTWNATKCVPVMDDPVQLDEPCFVVGNGVTGIDNCDLGLICWDTDAENQGTCVAYCTGMPAAPLCVLDYHCAVYSEGLGLCFDWCDPLTQDCDSDEVCIPTDYGFWCILDASGDEGQAHDPCEYANSCDPGLLCLNSNTASECDLNASGCCQPFCDTSLPNTCPGQGQQCIPWYDPPELGYENVGVCAVPP